jgi:hypothetical protein
MTGWLTRDRHASHFACSLVNPGAKLKGHMSTSKNWSLGMNHVCVVSLVCQLFDNLSSSSSQHFTETTIQAWFQLYDAVIDRKGPGGLAFLCCLLPVCSHHLTSLCQPSLSCLSGAARPEYCSQDVHDTFRNRWHRSCTQVGQPCR